MDLSLTLPDFPTKSYTHLLPLLDRAGITLKELLVLDALEIAKACRAPVTDIRKLTAHVLDALRQDLGLGAGSRKNRDNNGTYHLKPRGDSDDRAADETDRPSVAGNSAPKVLHPPATGRISTLDPVLDAALNGGISTGYLTEVTGESGAGKTQFLLHLLLSVQLPAPHGLSKNALYISTESDLATNRLSQLLNEHRTIQALHPHTPRPSLDNIYSVTTVDLESQEHIINYQIPVAISRYNIGIVIIDSITANYRAESSTENVSGLLERSGQLKKLGHFLRTLAVTHNIAIVVANQISDGFESTLSDPFPEEARDGSGSPLETPSASATPPFVPASQPYQQPKSVENNLLRGSSANSPQVNLGPCESKEDICNIPGFNLLLSLDYQQPFFTGWAQTPRSYLSDGLLGTPRGFKVPALGLIWTNQVGCRIVLKSKNSFQPADNYSPMPMVQNSKIDMRRTNHDAPNRIVETPNEKDTVTCSDRNDPDPSGNTQENEAQRNTEQDSTQPQPSSNSSQESFATLGDESWSDYTLIPASQYRGRLRQMQVVFSPWTSGNPEQSHVSGGRDGDTQHDEGQSSIKTAFDPMYNSAEFEILPQGLRGLARQPLVGS
ncbi:DNA repair protein RAD57 [Nannizzia gypsea CBS 118893]|uniref:DNA repair protein RAD57 n=1 Tax=Arthroderma gypseum (strain ATCC MYA-4604 / CBS 118893) TaxID=535722 RepID=E5R3H2_ARTGP|nr:DNA repair protein RAD57 [Nannizzia gypsea CBS 118893]EFQ98771.1 DNA repair protein RAD57 [Nannizzia gypsea CBS 118893]